MSEDEDSAPGWEALEAAVAVYVDGKPLHYGTANLPGSGVYGLNAYRAPGCWLVHTLGLSDLFGSGSDEEWSGWGIELTMRVPRAEADEAPPKWVLNLLMKLGGYVYSSGNVFEDGHRMDPGGPITGQFGTRLTAVAFVLDPQLGMLDTPNGRVEVLEVVGITADELSRMKASSTDEVLAELRERSSLLVTDPAR